jgi:hypothetical protein
VQAAHPEERKPRQARDHVVSQVLPGQRGGEATLTDRTDP